MILEKLAKHIDEDSFELFVEVMIDVSVKELLEKSNEELGLELKNIITNCLHDNE